ncbi:bifunctional DNA primase/polymerase [Streptomyces sp. SHP 1-2]|nr:bifunctional DNA primase/polymerase [Streptomyces sp. SHP 1-2]MYU20383.1 DNA primase [Streptomyces sp. SID8352]
MTAFTGAGAVAGRGDRGVRAPEAAARYAEECHWDVCPGTWLEMNGGAWHCSCGDPGCAAPGAHPARADWAAEATGSATVARRMWRERPEASVLLPTGRSFDVIEVPETAGFLALARMERREPAPGPVVSAPDRRMRFLVLPGAAAKVPDLVRGLGWAPATLDLAVLGAGGYVAAPPTRWGAWGSVRWVCRPTAANRWLPDAAELIAPLAYACARER